MEMIQPSFGQTHLDPADAPVTEDDAFIQRALEHASIPALMMSLVHLTGACDILDGDIRPRATPVTDVQGGLSEEDKATVRELAFNAITAYRDRGCSLPLDQPDATTIHRMMGVLVGEDVSSEYVPMMMEELALDGQDMRRVDLSAAARDGSAPQRVIVIGAGVSGLLTAMRLQDEGVDYVVIEKNNHVGGTWYENRYPGCRVDIPSHFYSYSFAPNHDWSKFFAQRDELFAYFDRLADESGVREHIRFNTEAVEARWDDPSQQWHVTVQQADGSTSTMTGSALVSGVGQLNRPLIPDFKGKATYKGQLVHSGAWPEGLDYAGKKVAVIGTAASAIQLVPELAKSAGSLTVFQRSPVWLLPNEHYHDDVSDEVRWLLKHIPYYARWFRFSLFYPATDGSLPGLEIDPDWPHQERSVNAVNEAVRNELTEYIRQQIPDDDDELFKKVVPAFPPFTKRMNQDNGSWLRALQQDNVELITDGIDAFNETGIVTTDGRQHDFDIIVCATGFKAGQFILPMQVYGREGKDIQQEWGDAPRAYLGITVPDFPNFFCLYGPSTNLAHGGSIILHSECQVRYVLQALNLIAENDGKAIAVKQSVYDSFVDKLTRTLEKMVWSTTAADSWYKNASGQVINTSPWRLVDYWKWTKEFNANDYDVVDAS